MKEYLRILTRTLEQGDHRVDRTKVGAYSVFGEQCRFDLMEGFPCLTTKKLHLRSIIHELLWFLKGDTNVKYLRDNGVTIWDEWTRADGSLGPVYGAQWRAWRGADGRTHDQILDAARRLKADPFSRRHIVSAWNVGDLDQMALAPCHCLFQFFVQEMSYEERVKYLGVFREQTVTSNSDDAIFKAKVLDQEGVPKMKLSCQLYQRSCDVFLGVPFNIASYALLTMMMAQVCDYAPGEFIHTFGDLHLYANHIQQAQLQLTREPRLAPRMWINPDKKDITAFVFEDFKLTGYDPHPSIKAEIAV